LIGSLDEFFEMLEMKGKGMAELLVLAELEEGPKSVYETLLSLKEKGLPIAMSTTYTLMKSLEQKGFVEALGEGKGKKYALTEEGKKYLEENREYLEKIRYGLKKLELAKAMGLDQAVMMIKDIFKVVDKLEPEERSRITSALMKAMAEIKPIIVNKLA